MFSVESVDLTLKGQIGFKQEMPSFIGFLFKRATDKAPIFYHVDF